MGRLSKSLEKAYSPCLQPRWPTTDNILPRFEIQDPNSNPKCELYSWDWEKDYVSQCAIKRIMQHTEIDGKIFSISESKNNPPPFKIPQTKQQKKEEEEIQQQLKLLKFRRVLLELQLRTRLK